MEIKTARDHRSNMAGTRLGTIWAFGRFVPPDVRTTVRVCVAYIQLVEVLAAAFATTHFPSSVWLTSLRSFIPLGIMLLAKTATGTRRWAQIASTSTVLDWLVALVAVAGTKCSVTVALVAPCWVIIIIVIVVKRLANRTTLFDRLEILT